MRKSVALSEAGAPPTILSMVADLYPAASRAGAVSIIYVAPLLGVMGAFVFAAQMINFPVGVGTSGHLVGGALLAYTLGPAPAAVVMTASATAIRPSSTSCCLAFSSAVSSRA